MNVVSLFDGISVARHALDLAGIEVGKYYAAEIDKHAMAVSKKNYPSIIPLGSVLDVNKTKIPESIDLLIGGSPCQDLSIAKQSRKGLEGERSGLFWQYIRIRDELKPKWFILENVASMSKKDRDIISEAMGCEPILFNASLVSAQCRKRLFWTNIPFTLPTDRNIVLKDILQPPADIDERMVDKNKKAYTLTASYAKVSPSENQIKNSVEKKQRTMVKVGTMGKNYNQGNSVYSSEGKSCTLSARGGGLGATTGLYIVSEKKQRTMVKLGHIGEIKEGKDHANSQGGQAHRVYAPDGISPTLGTTPPNVMDVQIRKLTPIECERLQSLPDNYTAGVAMTHRYKCLGNAFNAEVIAHILKSVNI